MLRYEEVEASEQRMNMSWDEAMEDMIADIREAVVFELDQAGWVPPVASDGSTPSLASFVGSRIDLVWSEGVQELDAWKSMMKYKTFVPGMLSCIRKADKMRETNGTATSSAEGLVTGSRAPVLEEGSA
jgi:hypothetical protein